MFYEFFPTRPSSHAWNMWNLLHWLRRCIVVAADQCCEICGADAMSERFYAFTCTHCCHEACLRPSDLQWLFSPLPILFVCAQNVLVANMQVLHACTGGYCLIPFVFIFTHAVAMIIHPLFYEVWLAGIVLCCESTLCSPFRHSCFKLWQIKNLVVGINPFHWYGCFWLSQSQSTLLRSQGALILPTLSEQCREQLFKLEAAIPWALSRPVKKT